MNLNVKPNKLWVYHEREFYNNMQKWLDFNVLDL